MFPPDTLVAMATGDQEDICVVEPGDEILSASGKADTVKYVVSYLYKSDIIKIDYQDGGTVSATEDQLFLTDRGPIRADNLVVGDRLRTPSYGGQGQSVFWDVEGTRRASYSGSVFMILTEGGSDYVAGGVAVAKTTGGPFS